MKRALRWLALTAGVALVAWFIYRAGPEEILRNIVRVGWWSPVLLVPYLLVYTCDAFGWYLSFGSDPRRPKFFTLFRVRWAAESINSYIPTAYIGGEALKVFLLHKRGVPTALAGTSVVTSKTSQVLTEVLFIACGAAAAYFRLPTGERGVRTGMILIAAASLLVATAIVLLQRRGMFGTLRNWVGYFSARLQAAMGEPEKVRNFDRKINAFYQHERGYFLGCSAAYFMGWLMDALEIFLVLKVLGFPVDWREAIAIEAFISVSSAVGIFVPGAMGVQESGTVLLFHIFGLSTPMAVTYAILRRARELFFVLVGAVLLYFEKISFKPLLASVPTPSVPTSVP